jgi:hypothetical protein
VKTTQYVRQLKTIEAADADIQAEDEAMAAEIEQINARLAPGHLYVVEFASGIVKVGKADNPKARVAAHAQLAEIHGGAVKSSWISRRLVAYTTAEKELIALCMRHGRVVAGREYFAIDGSLARNLASLVDHNRFLSGVDLSSVTWQDNVLAYGEDVAA